MENYSKIYTLAHPGTVLKLKKNYQRNTNVQTFSNFSVPLYFWCWGDVVFSKGNPWPQLKTQESFFFCARIYSTVPNANNTFYFCKNITNLLMGYISLQSVTHFALEFGSSREDNLEKIVYVLPLTRIGRQHTLIPLHKTRQEMRS